MSVEENIEVVSLASMEGGDPEATGKAVLKLVDTNDPPLRLGLGNPILPRAREAYRERLATWEAWQDVSMRPWASRRNPQQSGSSNWLTELHARHDLRLSRSSQQAGQ